MRSSVWFVVAGVIAVAGFAGAVIYLVPRLAAADAGMMRVVVPGNAVLVFDKPGPYMIYHEKKSTVDGRYYASDNVDGLSLGTHRRRDGRSGEAGRAQDGDELFDRQSQRHLDLRLHPRPARPLPAGGEPGRAAAAMPRRCWRSGRAWSAHCCARSSAPSLSRLPAWASPPPSCLRFCGSARRRSGWRRTDVVPANISSPAKLGRCRRLTPTEGS